MEKSRMLLLPRTGAILPLVAVMQVLDVIVSGMLEKHIAAVLPGVPECFIGAQPKTQTLDIALGLQSVIEMGLDDFGAAAVAQCDIEKYYDSIPVLIIAQCIIRHQMCSSSTLQAGSQEVQISNRSIGGLTRSRVAGSLGRIRVEATTADRRLLIVEAKWFLCWT